jgi:hypothetical protein
VAYQKPDADLREGLMFTPINGWTKQGMIAHIEKEFKGLSVNGTTCLYRSNRNGQVTKCAVGMFIPDDVYNVKMEMTLYESQLLKDFPVLHTLMPLNQQAMRDLQTVHDRFADDEIRVGGDSSRETVLGALIGWIERNVEG